MENGPSTLLMVQNVDYDIGGIFQGTPSEFL